MNEELSAQLTLGAYAAVALLVIWRQMRRCEHGWQVWLLYVVNRLMCGLMYHWRSNRPCPFPTDGPALIVANHRSPADPMLLWMGHHRDGSSRRIRAINFLMAREFFEVPSMNWMYRALRCIPVDRDAKVAMPVREAIRRLQAGELVGIFPEGRINTGPGLLAPGGTGVAFLALKSRVPVYPVFIYDSPQGSSMVDSFATTCRARLVYGDPIDLAPYYGRPDRRKCLEEVTELLMQQLAELGEVSEGAFTARGSVDTISIEEATVPERRRG